MELPFFLEKSAARVQLSVMWQGVIGGNGFTTLQVKAADFYDHWFISLLAPIREYLLLLLPPAQSECD